MDGLPLEWLVRYARQIGPGLESLVQRESLVQLVHGVKHWGWEGHHTEDPP